MRNFICIFCLLAVAVFCTACGADQDTEQEPQGSGDSIKIVTTIFPEYDWVSNILGDNPAGAEVEMMLDSGVDMHSYQPTSEDMLTIADSDLFIYVGGESDEWVEDAIEAAGNESLVTVNLMEALGDQVREEEIVPGMEAEEEEGEEAPEYDEHIWLSPENAKTLCCVIEEAIASVDPENAESYEANLAAYTEQIDAIDQEYADAVDQASGKTILFGDRFPFRYLTDQYGLDYYAAFVGCSAETEASFETIRFLASKVDELKLPAVCTIEGSDQKIAETVIQNTKSKDQQILTMNSMQSVTSADVEAGASWISIMKDNLEVLKEALR